MPGYRPTNGLQKSAREDVDLLRLALSQMWDVASDRKTKLIDSMNDIANNPMMHPSIRNDAARNILLMIGQNIKVVENITKAGILASQQQQIPIVADESEVAEGIKALLEQVPDTVNIPDPAIIESSFREAM